MKQVTLNIPENQFVQVNESVSTNIEDSLSPTQKKTWKLIKTGFDEFNEVRNGKRKARPIHVLLNELDAM